jgi:hypothetical protein
MLKRALAILSGVAIVASTLTLVPDDAAARFGGGGFRGERRIWRRIWRRWFPGRRIRRWRIQSRDAWRWI